MASLKIYLTNLAKYNMGELIGKWVDLPVSDKELQKIILEILGDDEEIFITDYENDYDFKIDKYSNIDELNNIADRLYDIEKNQGIEIIKAAFQEFSNIEYVIEVLENENYSVISGISSEEELGDYLVDEGFFGEIPEQLEYYIDTTAIGRDAVLNGDYTIYEDLEIAVSWY